MIRSFSSKRPSRAKRDPLSQAYNDGRESGLDIRRAIWHAADICRLTRADACQQLGFDAKYGTDLVTL